MSRCKELIERNKKLTEAKDTYEVTVELLSIGGEDIINRKRTEAVSAKEAYSNVMYKYLMGTGKVVAYKKLIWNKGVGKKEYKEIIDAIGKNFNVVKL